LPPWEESHDFDIGKYLYYTYKNMYKYEYNMYKSMYRNNVPLGILL